MEKKNTYNPLFECECGWVGRLESCVTETIKSAVWDSWFYRCPKCGQIVKLTNKNNVNI